MPVKYEALIGYVFKGMAVSDPPAGVLVQVAPRRAHRSREQDTLFVMVVQAGQHIARPEFYTNLATQAADHYFSSRLGVTGALREAAVNLNERIQEQNTQQAADYRVGAVFVVKRGDDVYVMRSGTTLCVAQQADGFTIFPGDPDMLNMLPLGARSEPMLEFTHFELVPNDLFVLGNASVAALDDDVLQAVVKPQNVELALDRLENATDHDGVAMIIQFVDTESDAVSVDEEPAEGEPPPVEAPAEEAVEEDEPAPSPPPVDNLPSLEEPASEPVVEARGKRQSLPRALALGCLMIGLGFLRAFVNGINAILDRLLPEPEKGERQQMVPMNLVALIAVGIPAIIGVIAVGFAISQRDTTRFDELKAEAQAAAADARLLQSDPTSDPIDRRNAWLEVLNWAERADQENPNDVEVRSIILEAQQRIDEYDNVTRVLVTRLRTFEEGATLRGPILAPDMSLFTLDRSRGHVYRDQLDSSGTRLIEEGESPIIAPARPVNEYIVSRIVDIEWMDDGGVINQNVLVALDENGLLVSYHGTFGLSALQLEVPPQWSRPVAVAMWTNRFYILDAGANQIWRFVPESRIYANPPEEYFQGNNRPDLTTAVDIGIDEPGLIYVLFADGTISKFEAGVPVDFELYQETAPVDGINNGQSLFVAPASSYSIFMTDQQNDAVYQISWGGTVNTGYRPANLRSNAFDRVTGVYADVRRGNIYVLSDNALYHIPVEN